MSTTATTTKPMGCPRCGMEITPAELFGNEEAHRAFARLAEVSVPLGARVISYVGLFAPPKTRLTIAKQARHILQLLPDLERRAINHRGRDWPAPLDHWAEAIDQMLAARDVGKLDLPMGSHAYLYSILAGMADKLEGRAEAQQEQQRRTGPARQDTVQVNGQHMPIGAALQQVYAGRDPALAKLDADARNATPMPAHLKEQIAGLRTGNPNPKETP